MKVDSKGVSFIKGFEGFSSVPYKCSAGVPTIGYGSTLYPNGRKVTMKDKPISKDEADKIFIWHLSHFEADVTMLIQPVIEKITQNQFNALVSFAYNLGSDIDADDIPEGLGDSTLLKKVLANPNDPAISGQLKLWNKAKGKVVDGLVRRRAEEVVLYFTK